LSKVETPAIRTRMVAHLLNVDAALARQVAVGLGMADLPKAAEPARAVKQDLPPSDALSIIRNGPESFAGRKLGVLVSDGADAKLIVALEQAVLAGGAVIELIGPTVGGVTLSNGKSIPVKQKVNGGPSVLYDAVAVIVSAEGAAVLAREATARDFVNDAFAHAKFIGYSEAAVKLFEKAGLTEMDAGMVALTTAADAKGFIKTCGQLRFWEREKLVHAV